MRIKLLKTPTVENKGKWSQMEVEFRNLDQDRLDTKKLPSFTFPDVFAALKSAAPDSTFTVTVTKNDKGYNDWTGITAGVAEAPAQAPAAAGAAAPVSRTGSVRPNTYETHEERARKELFLARKNALHCAVTLLGVGAKREDVLRLADEFADWTVTVKLNVLEDLLKMKDDVPY